MKLFSVVLLPILLFVIISSCEKSSVVDEFDTEPPIISIEYPAPCESVVFGETIRLKAKFSDNIAVKSYKLNLHHNFDHHTHGDHKEKCELDDIKIASTPYLNNWPVDLPETDMIDIDTTFALPSGYEGGDYHVLLYITDINGNQSWTGVSIKMEGE